MSFDSRAVVMPVVECGCCRCCSGGTNANSTTASTAAPAGAIGRGRLVLVEVLHLGYASAALAGGGIGRDSAELGAVVGGDGGRQQAGGDGALASGDNSGGGMVRALLLSR